MGIPEKIMQRFSTQILTGSREQVEIGAKFEVLWQIEHPGKLS
jgi:hypothetical protein